MDSAAIRANRRLTLLLMFFMTVACGLLGTALSYVFGWGLTGTGAFLMGSAAINVLAYWFSDRVVLAAAGAKPLTRSQAPELFEIVDSLALRASIPAPRLYLLEDVTMNAFATGRNRSRAAVAVTRGLLERLDRREVEGVVAHELSHVQNYDALLSAVVSVLAGGISILADMYWVSTARAQDRDQSGSLVLVGVALSVFAPLTALLVQLAISRNREFLADAQGARLAGGSSGLASALKKISLDMRLPRRIGPATAHLYFSSPSRSSWVDRLFSTHPPVEDRVAALERIVL